MTKVSALPLAKLVINVVERTTLGLCVSPKNLSQSVTQEGQMEPAKIDVHISVVYMKSM